MTKLPIVTLSFFSCTNANCYIKSTEPEMNKNTKKVLRKISKVYNQIYNIYIYTSTLKNPWKLFQFIISYNIKSSLRQKKKHTNTHISTEKKAQNLKDNLWKKLQQLQQHIYIPYLSSLQQHKKQVKYVIELRRSEQIKSIQGK